MSNTSDLTFLERVKIQAEVLLPLIKGFEAELGKDRAHAIAREALKGLVRESYKHVREKHPGNPLDIISHSFPTFAKNALQFEIVDQSPQALDVNVTQCAYAEFYQALGEPELGFLFVCDMDNAIAEGLGPDLEFKRSQTIMQGAKHCDFRYRRKE